MEINVGYVYDEIERAARAIGAAFSELPSHNVKHMISELDAKFAEWTKFAEGKGSKKGFFWEAMVNSVAIRNTEDWDWVGWQWLNDFIKDGEVLIWFEDWLGSDKHRDVIIEFGDGSRLVPIIGECFLFEFYLSNRSLDYLIALNHHDFLIAAGFCRYLV